MCMSALLLLVSIVPILAEWTGGGSVPIGSWDLSIDPWLLHRGGKFRRETPEESRRFIEYHGPMPTYDSLHGIPYVYDYHRVGWLSWSHYREVD